MKTKHTSYWASWNRKQLQFQFQLAYTHSVLFCFVGFLLLLSLRVCNWQFKMYVLQIYSHVCVCEFVYAIEQKYYSMSISIGSFPSLSHLLSFAPPLVIVRPQSLSVSLSFSCLCWNVCNTDIWHTYIRMLVM